MGKTHSQLLINLNFQGTLLSNYFPCQVVSKKERKKDVCFICGWILEFHTVLVSGEGLVIPRGWGRQQRLSSWAGGHAGALGYWSRHRLPDAKGFPWSGESPSLICHNPSSCKMRLKKEFNLNSLTIKVDRSFLQGKALFSTYICIFVDKVTFPLFPLSRPVTETTNQF